MTAFAPRVVAEPISSTVDLDAQARHATDGERNTSFPSDVIPLLEPLSRHPMRMTRNHADDAEDLRQHTLACIINSDGCSSSAILDK
jgi:DNA-directed RNA polymerase specialized sigma24 family protein